MVNPCPMTLSEAHRRCFDLLASEIKRGGLNRESESAYRKSLATHKALAERAWEEEEQP